MTKGQRFEKIMPEYLKHDIDEYMKYQDDPACTVIACLMRFMARLIQHIGIMKFQKSKQTI